jgi:copper oxidase (laccase) domain-containing protein
MSLDLADAVRNQLPGIVITDGFGCTMHNDRFHSFRQNATQKRQVTVAWIPQD